jgi:hypothetical protein
MVALIVPLTNGEQRRFTLKYDIRVATLWKEFFLDDVEKFFKSQGHRSVEVGFGKSSSVEYTVYELREVASGVLQSNSIEVEIAEQSDDSGH